ncbi:MAG: TM0106 family RecB-like putative nuclease, partial [Jiangellaceae bacterium]
MFLLDGAVVYSASDLTEAAGCEFAVLRRFDEVLGRLARRVVEPDAMQEYAARLGDEHERRVLAQFAEAGSVHEVAMANTRDAASLRASHDDTIAALRSGVDVVFQGSFFDGRFHGRADFLVREPGTSTFAVYDTKLARHAKITALLQLAAYADQMIGAGVSPAPEVHLILGDGSTTTHRLADLLPVYRVRRARLEEILAEHRAASAPAAWGDPR